LIEPDEIVCRNKEFISVQTCYQLTFRLIRNSHNFDKESMNRGLRQNYEMYIM